MNIKSSTAIVFFPENSRLKPHKYRKVTKRDKLIEWLFRKYAATPPEKINWYDTKTKAFEETTHF